MKESTNKSKMAKSSTKNCSGKSEGTKTKDCGSK